MGSGWSPKTVKRARMDRARRRATRRQKQHLKSIKSEDQLRLIRLGSRVKQ